MKKKDIYHQIELLALKGSTLQILRELVKFTAVDKQLNVVSKQAWASARTLSELTGYCHRTAQSALQKLVDLGILIKIKRYKSDGRFKANLYKFAFLRSSKKLRNETTTNPDNNNKYKASEKIVDIDKTKKQRQTEKKKAVEPIPSDPVVDELCKKHSIDKSSVFMQGTIKRFIDYQNTPMTDGSIRRTFTDQHFIDKYFAGWLSNAIEIARRNAAKREASRAQQENDIARKRAHAAPRAGANANINKTYAERQAILKAVSAGYSVDSAESIINAHKQRTEKDITPNTVLIESRS